MKTGNLSIFDTILNDFSDVKFRRNYLSDYDVHRTEDGAYYVFSVPGFNKSNLKVDVDDTILTIDGSRVIKSSSGDKTKSVHFSYDLGLNIDTSKLEATIEDGLLSIFIPNEINLSHFFKPQRLSVITLFLVIILIIFKWFI
jgi:HSP20 family molecular chaperone IbpA